MNDIVQFSNMENALAFISGFGGRKLKFLTLKISKQKRTIETRE